jgi:hypothetical protein
MLIVLPASADIDESAYEAGKSVYGERERQRRHEELADEAAAERQRAEAEAAAEARAQAEAAAREAARPYPERLTRRQCTVCHEAGNFSTRRHTWIVWRIVVARMVWVNGAAIDAESQGVIASYLAETYPAGPEERIVEYGWAVALLTLMALVVWAGRRLLDWRRRTLN